MYAGKPGFEVYNSLMPIVHSSADTAFFEKEFVRMIKGDDFIMENNISQVNLMKVDVEGAELSVLKGFVDSFRQKIINTIVIEITQEMGQQFGYQIEDVIKFLIPFGYSWYHLQTFGKLIPIKDTQLLSGMYVAKLN